MSLWNIERFWKALGRWFYCWFSEVPFLLLVWDWVLRCSLDDLQTCFSITLAIWPTVLCPLSRWFRLACNIRPCDILYETGLVSCYLNASTLVWCKFRQELQAKRIHWGWILEAHVSLHQIFRLSPVIDIGCFLWICYSPPSSNLLSICDTLLLLGCFVRPVFIHVSCDSWCVCTYIYIHTYIYIVIHLGILRLWQWQANSLKRFCLRSVWRSWVMLRFWPLLTVSWPWIGSSDGHEASWIMKLPSICCATKGVTWVRWHSSGFAIALNFLPDQSSFPELWSWLPGMSPGSSKQGFSVLMAEAK